MNANLVSNEEFDLLRKRGHIREYSRGQYVVHEGMEAHSIYLLISGSLTVLTEDEVGNELCANILGAGDFFGEMGLCTSDWLRSASVQAREKSMVLEMEYTSYLRLAETHQEFLVKIIHQLAKKLGEMTTRARQFVHMGAAERVLYVLRDLARMSDVVQGESGALVSITKKELGNMAGCSRETASRALQELEGNGLITNQGRKVMVNLSN